MQPQQPLSNDTSADTKISHIDAELLGLLVCPITKAPVVFDKENQQLFCPSSSQSYSIKDGIPIMISPSK